MTNSSFLYKTEPMYFKNQPAFLNAVIEFQTSMEPHTLLSQIKEIEQKMGRDLEHGLRNGPRPIDIDILFFNSQKIDTESLTIPHPRIHERAFVL
jgi:2-amino-4-hydroxy-6-hydroxymethyldihydropteridine diphosphokinase